ncbi:MAG: aldo/keto reductase [Lachnospiraceae bacterium]|nr:aldo/keto reductase [Lachnospiraceae bacterium]
MQYRKAKNGEALSALGFGCMRFTTKSGRIDLEKMEKELLLAVEKGINYFDTAYIYPGSEAALGWFFNRHPDLREKIYIATKLPQYLIGNRSAIDRYFNEEKKRLGTQRIDFYLMHMLTDIRSWDKMVSLGIKDWIAEKKKTGEIGNIGFSYHGDTEMFLEILNAFNWDFCQIQYNYLDEHTQAGRKGLLSAAKKGIPVIIMEPLRGGRLVDLLPGEAKDKISAFEPKTTPAALAFRWLYDQPEVTVVLSGMNDAAMVEENCAVASESEPGSLSGDEKKLIEEVKKIIQEKVKVGCTGCRYCMPCPKNVDIPGIFRLYNQMYTEKKSSARHEFIQTIGLRETPMFASECIGCGKCEQHCPQHLPVRELLKEADRALRPFHYRITIFFARKFVLRKKRGSDSKKQEETG